MNSTFKYIVSSFLIVISSISCGKETSAEDEFIGKKINLMSYAVIPYNTNGKDYKINQNAKFKILSYVNLYCEPCWQYTNYWKIFFANFKEYPEVQFLFYVIATPEDFDFKNNEAKLDFPVLLDRNQRFGIVNQLGSAPMTFLLNDKNEVLLCEPPYTEEMKKKYISIITNKNEINKK